MCKISTLVLFSVLVLSACAREERLRMPEPRSAADCAAERTGKVYLPVYRGCP